MRNLLVVPKKISSPPLLCLAVTARLGCVPHGPNRAHPPTKTTPLWLHVQIGFTFARKKASCNLTRCLLTFLSLC